MEVMEKKMETTILGLYGNYFIGIIWKLLYWDYMETILLGVYGNYFIGIILGIELGFIRVI